MSCVTNDLIICGYHCLSFKDKHLAQYDLEKHNNISPLSYYEYSLKCNILYLRIKVDSTSRKTSQPILEVIYA